MNPVVKESDRYETKNERMGRPPVPEVLVCYVQRGNGDNQYDSFHCASLPRIETDLDRTDLDEPKCLQEFED